MQDQREPMPDTAGDTGSKYENEANATAGVIMRHFDRKYPNYFEQPPVDENTDSGELDEGRVANIAAAAAMAASLVGCATPQSNGQPMTVGQAADVARAAYGLRNLSRAGAQEEFNQELKNYLRARRGEAGAANQSKIYQMQQGQVKENASGYIPTKKQAKDRRFVMALSKDVQPGEVGRQANKLALDVGKQGEPHLLITGAANQIGEKK